MVVGKVVGALGMDCSGSSCGNVRGGGEGVGGGDGSGFVGGGDGIVSGRGSSNGGRDSCS